MISIFNRLSVNSNNPASRACDVISNPGIWQWPKLVLSSCSHARALQMILDALTGLIPLLTHTAASRAQVHTHHRIHSIWVNKTDLDENNRTKSCHHKPCTSPALRLFACTYMCPVMLISAHTTVRYNPSDGAVRCCGASSSSSSSSSRGALQERVCASGARCRQMQNRSAR